MATSNLGNLVKAENFLSFSPADISIYMYNVRIGNCLSVNYSIQREVIALFAFGDPNAQGFNKGKRGIAGSLVFNVFQNHPILRSGWGVQVGLDSVNQLSGLGLKNSVIGTQGFSPDNLKANLSTNTAAFGGSINLDDASVRANLQDSYNIVARRAMNYADQLPPFDIVLTFVNEVGDAAVMSINGCIIGNEAGGYSVDDITSEMAFTFIARSVSPLTAFFPSSNPSVGDLLPSTGSEFKFSRNLGF